MNRVKAFIYFILLWNTVAFSQIQSQSIVFLDDTTKEISLKNCFLFFEDTQDKSFEWILEHKDKVFKTNTPSYVEHPESTYWLTFQVKTASKSKWILELLDFYAQEVSVYIPQKNGSYSESTSGRNFPFQKRSYATVNLAYNLPTLSDTTYDVFIKVKSPNQASFSFSRFKST